MFAGQFKKLRIAGTHGFHDAIINRLGIFLGFALDGKGNGGELKGNFNDVHKIFARENRDNAMKPKGISMVKRPALILQGFWLYARGAIEKYVWRGRLGESGSDLFNGSIQLFEIRRLMAYLFAGDGTGLPPDAEDPRGEPRLRSRPVRG